MSTHEDLKKQALGMANGEETQQSSALDGACIAGTCADKYRPANPRKSFSEHSTPPVADDSQMESNAEESTNRSSSEWHSKQQPQPLDVSPVKPGVPPDHEQPHGAHEDSGTGGTTEWGSHEPLVQLVHTSTDAGPQNDSKWMLLEHTCFFMVFFF